MADTDYIYSGMAHDAIIKLYNYIYTNGIEKLAEIDGKDTYAVTFKDFHPDEKLFHDVIVLFIEKNSTDNIKRHGSVIKLNNEPYKLGICLYVRERAEKQDLLNVVWRDNQETLLHEIIHVIDIKRAKGQLPDFDANSRNMKEYHNDPLELNAYYHNIAYPLIRIITEIKTSGHEFLDLYETLPDNFNDMLGYLIKKMRPATRQHWQSLTSANKNRLIRRLYNQFKIYYSLLP